MSATVPLSARAWHRAVIVVFLANGVAVATWMSRMPALRDQLDVPISQVGVLLAAVATGAIIGLLSAAAVIRRIGAGRTILIGLTAMAVALAFTGAVATFLGNFPLALAGMAFVGFTGANVDIAMNVEGAQAERANRRSYMPWYHGCWSLGTVGAGGVGAAMAFADIPLVIHFGVMAAVIAVVGVIVVRWLPAATGADRSQEQPLSRRERWAIWRDPRTVLIGVIVLGMAFAEGSANDWLALALVDERGFDHGPAALMFSLFAGSMMVGRFISPPLLERFGRVPMLYGAALLAVAGMLLVMLVPVAGVTVAGVVLWGLGASLGFPVGMSAAADDPRTATTRVAIVSLIGYMAFLVGPPVLGFVGERTGLMVAYSITLGLVVLAALASPAARDRAR